MGSEQARVGSHRPCLWVIIPANMADTMTEPDATTDGPIREQPVIRYLREEPDRYIDQHGELTGTDAQQDILSVATGDTDQTVGDVMRTTGRSDTYIRQVLRRADPSAIHSEQPQAVSPGAEPERTVPTLTARLEIQGVGTVVEVPSREYCEECGEMHDVSYFVPVGSIGYGERPPCGSTGRYESDRPPEWIESARRARDIIGEI